MPEELEGDLRGTVVWGADMRGSTFRDVDLTGTRITHSALVDVEVDARVERLVVNGVDVTAYVAERAPWHPLRTTGEARAVWSERRAAVTAFLADVADDALAGTVDVLENGPHTVRQCVQVVFEETFWHLRDATPRPHRAGRTTLRSTPPSMPSTRAMPVYCHSAQSPLGRSGPMRRCQRGRSTPSPRSRLG